MWHQSVGGNSEIQQVGCRNWIILKFCKSTISILVLNLVIGLGTSSKSPYLDEMNAVSLLSSGNVYEYLIEMVAKPLAMITWTTPFEGPKDHKHAKGCQVRCSCDKCPLQVLLPLWRGHQDQSRSSNFLNYFHPFPDAWLEEQRAIIFILAIYSIYWCSASICSEIECDWT